MRYQKAAIFMTLSPAPTTTLPDPQRTLSQTFTVFAADANGHIDDVPDRLTIITPSEGETKPSISLAYGEETMDENGVSVRYGQDTPIAKDRIHAEHNPLSGTTLYLLEDMPLDLDRSGTIDPAHFQAKTANFTGNVMIGTVPDSEHGAVNMLMSYSDGLSDCCSSRRNAELQELLDKMASEDIAMPRAFEMAHQLQGQDAFTDASGAMSYMIDRGVMSEDQSASLQIVPGQQLDMQGRVASEIHSIMGMDWNGDGVPDEIQDVNIMRTDQGLTSKTNTPFIEKNEWYVTLNPTQVRPTSRL